ncbi:MAG: pseudaminic acid cytidylyltransferase [Dissulfuribacterales bacterium]
MNLAVIPARGGSKRIPLKNIKPFLGKPIIAYSIEAAQTTGLFDKIIVSTDSRKIAGIAEFYGAGVPFLRPDKLADDYTGTNAVIKHALEWFADNGEQVDYACCIYATAPLLEPQYIVHGYDKLCQTNAPFVFSATSFEFPIQRAVRINQNGAVEAFFPEYIKMRSQDMENAYHDAGQFYWGRADSFVNGIDLYSSGSLPIVLPRYLVQDIDTLDDWKRAELMYEIWEKISA